MSQVSPKKPQLKKSMSSSEFMLKQIGSMTGSLVLGSKSSRKSKSKYLEGRSSREGSGKARLLKEGSRRNRINGKWAQGQKQDWWTLPPDYLLYFSVLTSFLNLILLWQVACEYFKLLTLCSHQLQLVRMKNAAPVTERLTAKQTISASCILVQMGALVTTCMTQRLQSVASPTHLMTLRFRTPFPSFANLVMHSESYAHKCFQ